MNGYTGILEEKQVTFAEFTWRCARACAPLIHMRDSAPDAPVKKPKSEFFTKTYAERRLEEVIAEKVVLDKMTVAQMTREVEADHRKAMQQWEDSRLKKTALRKRTEKLLAEARAWSPPTKDHQPLKDFMLEELNHVLTRDCEIYEKPVKPDPEKYLAQRREMVVEDIARYQKTIAEEEAKRKGFSADRWIDQLHASVPCPTGAP